MENWLAKTLAAAENFENTHTWEKFGQQLQASSVAVPKKESAFVGATPSKRRVFGIAGSFWISLILVGGTYLLINGVSYEKALNRLFDTLIEESGVTEQGESIRSDFKAYENKDLGFKIEIPERMHISTDDGSTTVFFIESQKENDSRSQIIIAERYQALSPAELDTYKEQIELAYTKSELVLEESLGELSGFPAKKYVYKFEQPNFKLSVIDLILLKDGFVYKISMSDNTEDFPASLAEFELVRESFTAR